MAADEGKAPGIKRELSVEDLFAPLNRLDVRHPSCSAADASPNLKSRVPVLDDVCPSADISPNPTPRVSSVFETQFATQQQRFSRPDATLASTVDCERIRNPSSPAAKLNSCFLLDMAPIPEETGSGYAEKSGTRTHGFIADCSTDEGGSATGYALAREQMRTKSLSTASDTGLQTQGNSSSGEDGQVVDDRKQRRMLSNRESARRSRLRKQQHLDELRGHVAQLRAQNSQMMNSFSVASQQFAQITEENRQLRSEAMDLSHKLQRLHHTVASQRANNGLRLVADSRKEVQAPQY